MRRAFTAVVLAGLALLVCLKYADLMEYAGRYVVRDDMAVAAKASAPADYAILLMGDDSGMRADAACQVYKNNLASHILFFEEIRRGFVKLGLQKSGAEVHAAYLKSCGLPPEAIVAVSDCPTDSTVDEGHCAVNFFKDKGTPGRLIVVTSWYHSGRAGWLFERIFPTTTIQMKAATTPESHAEEWWNNKYSVQFVLAEYLKWTYWLIKQPH